MNFFSWFSTKMPTYPYSLSLYVVFVVGVLTLLGTLILKVIRYRSDESVSNIPPGSRGWPFVGETFHFMAAVKSRNGFYDFVKIRRARYGKCFKTKIFGQTHVFVTGPESAKAILNNETGKFTKRYIRSIAELVGDQSLLCASQNHHKILRNRLTNLFSTNTLSLTVKYFDQLVVDTLGQWKHDGVVVVLNEALKITFKSMCKMLMSLESEEELNELQKDVGLVCEAMLALPLRLPYTRFYEGIQARKRIMRRLEKIISERRRERSRCHEDFLQHLLKEEDNKQPSLDHPSSMLTDVEIEDNILTMIIAGQDTTASALTWMVKYIGENQKVLDILMVEQRNIAVKTSKKSFLTLEDLNDMPYASKVVKESLRMASVVPWFPRLVLQDCEIEGFKIKKGWNINLDSRSIHQDPMVYVEPDQFNPSRFDDETKVAYSFLAFGMGGRTCLGLNMAKAMMLVFLHRLVTTYKWEVIDSDSSIENWALFSKLKCGCPIHVTRRIKEEDDYIGTM